MALSKYMTEQVRPCKFGLIFETYSKDDQATLSKWVSDRLSAARIVNAIVADNASNRITSTSLLIHLRGQCGCSKDSPLKGVYRASE
jgi:hypothetical protein